MLLLVRATAILFLHKNVVENMGLEFAADFNCPQVDYGEVLFKKLPQFIFTKK